MIPLRISMKGFLSYQAELVQSRREGTFVYYSTKPEMVSELVRLLTACC